MNIYLLPGEIDQQIIDDVNGEKIKLDYRISSFGRVISFKSNLPKVLNPTINKQGYAVVNLYSPHFEKGKKQFRVHRLVGSAFKENPDGLPYVHHKNSIKSDNRRENLAWATHKENSGEAAFRGDIKSDLPAQALYEIRQKRFLYAASDEELALEYGVNKRRVSDYFAGRSRLYCAEKIRNGEYDDVVDDVDIVLTLPPGSPYK